MWWLLGIVGSVILISLFLAILIVVTGGIRANRNADIRGYFAAMLLAEPTDINGYEFVCNLGHAMRLPLEVTKTAFADLVFNTGDSNDLRNITYALIISKYGHRASRSPFARKQFLSEMNHLEASARRRFGLPKDPFETLKEYALETAPEDYSFPWMPSERKPIERPTTKPMPVVEERQCDCDQCGRRVSYKPDLEGKVVVCPLCNQATTLKQGT